MSFPVIQLLKALAIVGLLYFLTASFTVLGAKTVPIRVSGQLPALSGFIIAVSYLFYEFYTSRTRPLMHAR